MKKLILSLSLVLLTIAATAQYSPVNQLYSQYKGAEGVTSIRIPGFVMKLAARIGGLDAEERQLVGSMKSVSVLTIDEPGLYRQVNFAEEIRCDRMREDYKILMEVHDGKDDIIIAARERKGCIRDLLVIVGGSDNTLVHIRGRMNEDLLDNLYEVAGMDELRLTKEI